MGEIEDEQETGIEEARLRIWRRRKNSWAELVKIIQCTLKQGRTAEFFLKIKQIIFPSNVIIFCLKFIFNE